MNTKTITWEKLLKCETCEKRDICQTLNPNKGVSWDVFITWVCIGLFVVNFWLWLAVGILKVIYLLK